jgi:hypothetical protein
MRMSRVPSLLPTLLLGTGWEISLDLSQEASQDFSRNHPGRSPGSDVVCLSNTMKGVAS